MSVYSFTYKNLKMINILISKAIDRCSPKMTLFNTLLLIYHSKYKWHYFNQHKITWLVLYVSSCLC